MPGGASCCNQVLFESRKPRRIRRLASREQAGDGEVVMCRSCGTLWEVERAAA